MDRYGATHPTIIEIMVRVHFTSHLLSRYSVPDTIEVNGNTVAFVLQSIREQYPGLTDYIVDERGRLRQHVNIFVGNERIQDRERLSDPVAQTDEVYIMQALSGG